MLAGELTLRNTVLLSVGPGLQTPDTVNGYPEDYKGFTFYSSSGSKVGGEAQTITNILESGIIALDIGILSGGVNSEDVAQYCAEYATVCPGTYTYDENGIRVDSCGGGDEEYRKNCCGDLPWTPVYKKPEED